jgi:hypothetical protein
MRHSVQLLSSASCMNCSWVRALLAAARLRASASAEWPAPTSSSARVRRGHATQQATVPGRCPARWRLVGLYAGRPERQARCRTGRALPLPAWLLVLGLARAVHGACWGRARAGRVGEAQGWHVWAAAAGLWAPAFCWQQRLPKVGAGRARTRLRHVGVPVSSAPCCAVQACEQVDITIAAL